LRQYIEKRFTPKILLSLKQKRYVKVYIKRIPRSSATGRFNCVYRPSMASTLRAIFLTEL